MLPCVYPVPFGEVVEESLFVKLTFDYAWLLSTPDLEQRSRRRAYRARQQREAVMPLKIGTRDEKIQLTLNRRAVRDEV